MMRKLLLSLLLVLFAATLVQAEESSLLTPEAMWQLDRIGSPVISPDGTRVVAPVTSYDLKSDEAETRLWLFAADGSSERPLTAAGQSASSPVFCPAGKFLAFVSRRDKDEAGQIYILSMEGPGEAQRLTELPVGASGLKWVGEHIYFVAKVWPGMSWEEMAERGKKDKDSKVSAWRWTALPYSSWDHFLDEDRQNHLFRVSVRTGEIEPLTEPLGYELSRSGAGAGSYDVHPEGQYFAFVADTANERDLSDADLFLARFGEDKAINLTADNPAWDGAPLFSPDGKTLAFQQRSIVGFYADTARTILHDLASGERRRLHANWDRSPSGLVWLPDSSGFYASVEDAGTVRVYLIDAQDRQPRALTRDTSYGGLAVSGKGTLVGSNESFLYPPRLVRIDPESGKVEAISHINDERLASLDLGTYESVSFRGHDGAEIQMWVNYPPGFNKRKKYPLFLLIHGGPHGAINDSYHFRWNAQTFAAWGYVTAWYNFHGSSGFGQDFVDYINPDWITAPYADTLGAAQWFADQPWIDNDRMVAGGGSYGGYLSSILLGRDHPFNALLIHAPVYNMYSQMAADFAVHAERFGHFWDKPEIYREISPHYYAENFDTPALIIHGQNDLRVPVGQAFELFRTLQARGVESRLIYYPDENHWVLKPNNSLYWYEQVRDWFAGFAAPGAR